MKPLILTSTALLALSIGCQGTKTESRPNIIYILADDMGYGDVGYLNPESRIPTPNLDELCREGMVFKDAHSSSSFSTPSRYGVMTGRYAWRGQLKKGNLNGYSPRLIEQGRTTVASLLQRAGYTTAVVGKWHLGWGWVPKDPALPVDKGNVDFSKPLTYSPNDSGFDYSFCHPASLDMTPYVYIENGMVTDTVIVPMEDQREEQRGIFWRGGEKSASFDITRTLDVLAEKAVAVIDRAAQGDKPLFLYFPLTAPHTPFLPSEQFRGKSPNGYYGDFLMHVDDVVGRITEALERNGMDDNTLLIFTSDNGARWYPDKEKAIFNHDANYIFRGQKSDLWDGGHRMPFIARWRGVVKPSSENSNLICHTDLLATCAQITGQTLGDDEGEDSFSILPLLKGGKREIRSRLVHQTASDTYALRTKEWKYIDLPGSGGWSYKAKKNDPPVQLYNMKEDIRETKNLWDQYPEKVKEMKKMLDEQKAARGARFVKE